MTFKAPVAFSLAFLLVGQSHAFAISAPLELKWSELNAVIFEKTVELTLPNAVTVKGDVAAVREDGLVLDIKRTSDSKVFAKGNGLIPRASVKFLKLEKRGTNWRTMGTVIGGIAGVALGGYVAAKTANSEGPGIAIFIATASGTAIAGRILGGAADTTRKTIRVVP